MNRIYPFLLVLLLSAGCVERNPYYQGDETRSDGAVADLGPVETKDGSIAGGDTGWSTSDGSPDSAGRVDSGMEPSTDRGVTDDAARAPRDGSASDIDGDDDGVPASDDCDDGDPFVFPGAPEKCDGKDQDCDQSVDEDFAVGEVCTVGEGGCSRSGVVVCAADGTAGCDAEPGLPAVETCNGEDDDCDGTPDEGVLNRCGGCGDDFVERCNGLDDDCDEEIDEEWDLGAVCFDGEGACRRGGVVVCGGEAGTQCSATAADPSEEICNGLDDDCDAFVDEDLGLGEGCTEGVGACAREGTLQCGADGRVQCSAMPGPREVELCNALDDDCDGETDEGFALGQVCFVGEGACQVDGRTACADGGEGIECLAPEPVRAAEICDQEDNDCDGRTDEGLLNVCGVCGPEPEEVCDGEDNDCDGRADEGVLNPCGECGPVPDEVCDALDQDCDGQVDEELPVCVVGLGSLPANDDLDARGFGSALASAGDITGDGIPDLYVAAPEGERGAVTLVDGQLVRPIWTVEGDAGFGTSIVAYRFAPDLARILAVGSPQEEREGRVYLYTPDGEQFSSFGGSNGFTVGKTLVAGDDSSLIALSDPDLGLLDNGAIRVLDVVQPDEQVTLEGNIGERLGEQLFLCPDLDRDAVPELLATVRFNFLRDRGAVIYGSANFGQRSERLQSAQQTSQFGRGFTAGDFAGDGRTYLVFGDPDHDRARGQIHFFVDIAFLPRTLRTGQRNDGQGHVLSTFPRMGEPDRLIVGSESDDAVEIWRLGVRNDGTFSIDENISVTREGVEDSFGRAFALSEPAADGTRRLFIGEPDADRGLGAIHVFSIR